MMPDLIGAGEDERLANDTPASAPRTALLTTLQCGLTRQLPVIAQS
jgi:hypothetical protein